VIVKIWPLGANALPNDSGRPTNEIVQAIKAKPRASFNDLVQLMGAISRDRLR
jgi:hypothetical protein